MTVRTTEAKVGKVGDTWWLWSQVRKAQEGALHTTSQVTIENLPDRDFGAGCQQAPDKLPTTSVLFNVR
jgi:hypothetical protein